MGEEGVLLLVTNKRPLKSLGRYVKGKQGDLDKIY